MEQFQLQVSNTNMISESKLTYIKTSSKIRSKDDHTSHRDDIKKQRRHMIPIDLLLQDFSIANDSEIIFNRLRHMLKDCNLDEISISGVTALTQSALDGRLESVRFLVELGADVNKLDRFGWAPLHYAASEGYEDICSYLLQKGADCRVRTKQGEFAAELADDDNVVRVLLNATFEKEKLEI